MQIHQMQVTGWGQLARGRFESFRSTFSLPGAAATGGIRPRRDAVTLAENGSAGSKITV
jgi:hypothetical protein